MGAELAQMLQHLRREAWAPQMMSTALGATINALGAAGAAVIHATPGSTLTEPEVLHRAGIIGTIASTPVALLHRAAIGTPESAREPDGCPVIVAVCRQDANDAIGLAVWRRPGARTWDGEDAPLVDALAGIIRLLLDRAASRHEATRAVRADPLTTLLAQRAFAAEVSRRFARLDRDALPGTLMLAEVASRDSVRGAPSADTSDQVIPRAATLLQGIVRPTDLIGRVGDSELAVWLDGADHLTAAERAESLCLRAPSRSVGPRDAMQPELSFSIGIATRGAGESFGDMLRRADNAVREVKRSGGGYWLVSLGPPA